MNLENRNRRRIENAGEEISEIHPSSFILHPFPLCLFSTMSSNVRWPRLKRFAGCQSAGGIMAAVTLVVSIVAPALLPRNPLPRATAVRDLGNQDPILSHFEMRPETDTDESSPDALTAAAVGAEICP